MKKRISAIEKSPLYRSLRGDRGGISFLYAKAWLAFLQLCMLIGMLTAQTLTMPTQVITNETITRSGVNRLSDLLMLIDDWHVSSVDGFIWDVSPGGLSSFRTQSWLIMIDGVRMDINLLDINSINMLPLSIEQVDSVEIINSPQIYQGEFTDRGLIHIYTHESEPGLSLGGLSWYGNETGDPGPFVFTEQRTRNVDRLGPEFSNYINYRTRNWAINTGFMDHNHYSTDPAIGFRNPGRRNSYLWMQMLSLWLRTELRLDKERHEFFGGYTTTRDFLFDGNRGAGPLFIRQLGREVATERVFEHVGMRGLLNPSPKSQIAYRIQYSASQLDSNKLEQQLSTINWTMKQLYVNFESRISERRYSATIGVGWQRFNVDTRSELISDKFSLSRIYGQLFLRPGQPFQYALGGAIYSNDVSSSLKGYGLLKWQLPDRKHLSFAFSISERLLAEDNNLWFWHNRGYDLLASNEIDFEMDGEFRESNQLTTDLDFSHQITDNLDLELRGFFRHFNDLYIDYQRFRFLTSPNRFEGPIRLATNQSGQVIGSGFTFEQDITAKLGHRLSYQYQRGVSGDSLFTETWRAIPRHKFRWQIDFHPLPNFSIWGSMSAVGQSYWADFTDIQEQTDGRFRARVPGYLIFDLAIQKYAWKRRLRGNMLFRNLSNDSQQFHPIGFSNDLQFYVQLELRFNSL